MFIIRRIKIINKYSFKLPFSFSIHKKVKRNVVDIKLTRRTTNKKICKICLKAEWVKTNSGTEIVFKISNVSIRKSVDTNTREDRFSEWQQSERFRNRDKNNCTHENRISLIWKCIFLTNYFVGNYFPFHHLSHQNI